MIGTSVKTVLLDEIDGEDGGHYLGEAGHFPLLALPKPHQLVTVAAEQAPARGSQVCVQKCLQKGGLRGAPSSLVASSWAESRPGELGSRGGWRGAMFCWDSFERRWFWELNSRVRYCGRLMQLNPKYNHSIELAARSLILLLIIKSPF